MKTFLGSLNTLCDKDRFVKLPPKVLSGEEKELKENDFKDMHVIGAGLIGEVIWAQSKFSNKGVALKKINKKQIKSQNLINKVQDEINVLYTMDHPNVVKLYSHFETKKFIYLVQEYANSGTLYREIEKHKDKKLTKKEAVGWTSQIVKAMEYIHSNNIIHKDLKTENILLHKPDPSQAAIIKICDFGWSNFNDKDKKRNTFGGTIEYLSPEMLTGQSHTQMIDIWSLGVIIYELLTGKTPFQPKVKEKNKDKLFRITRDNILTLNYTFPAEFPGDAQDLVARLLGPFAKVVELERKLSLPHTDKATLEIDRCIDKYQAEKQKRRSQLAQSPQQIRGFQSVQLLNYQLSHDESHSSDGSDTQEERKLKKEPMERPIEQLIQEVDEGSLMGSEIMLSNQPSKRSATSAKMEGPDIVVEEFEQQKFKGRRPYQLKTSGVDFDKINQASPTPKQQELQIKVKQLEEMGKRSHRGTVYAKLPLSLTQYAPIATSLMLNSEPGLVQQRDALKQQLEILTEDNTELKLHLDILSNEGRNQPVRESLVETYMRQSTVNYQNFDSDSKMAYYNLLLSKIPTLKSEKYCQKNTLMQQRTESLKLDEISHKNQEIKQELNKIMAYKKKLTVFIETLRNEIQKTVDNTNFMLLETEEFQTQEKIENLKSELHQKYQQTQKPLKLGKLEELKESLNQSIIKLGARKRTKGSSPFDAQFEILSSIDIKDNKPTISSESFEYMIPGRGSNSISISPEVHNILKQKEAALTRKFEARIQQLEQQFLADKCARDEKINKLKQEISEARSIVAMKQEIDDQYEQVLNQRTKETERIQELTKKEEPLRNQVEVQMKNIQFMEEQIKQLEKSARMTLQKQS